jgi:putative DNA primase/helicase
MRELPPPLAALAAYRQFIVYRLLPSVTPGKTDKLPADHRTGRVANAHDSSIWCDFPTAAAANSVGRGDGVGFVFTANDPFFFVDVDGALRPDNSWSPGAIALAARFPGAAVELSQSGRGFHIIGRGVAPAHSAGNVAFCSDPVDGSVALYTSKRFVALTGQQATGDADTDHSATLAELVPAMFPPGSTPAGGSDEWTTGPVLEWRGPTDDDGLLRQALASADRSAAAAFGGEGVSFRDLWEGNADALAERWPGDNGPYDASAADFALAARLAFWTGKDCERIRTLMYRSALVRQKWEARGDYYLSRTILRACGVSADVLGRASAHPVPPAQAEHDCYPGSLSIGGQPTEETLAREFVTINGGKWRYDHTAGNWHHWNGQCWERDQCRLIAHLISDHLRATVAAGLSRRIANSKTVRGVETLVGSNPVIAVTNERWDADPWLLGTPAGTVDLRTGKIHAAKPDEHITRRTTVAPGDGEPALWLRFLHEAVGGDLESIGFLHHWCGYCLTGCTQEHAFAFVYGPGGNGKSVFLNTVTGILGNYAVTAAMETFATSRHDRHSTELAMLRGARLVTASETEQGRGWDEARVKALTGGDPITARFMRQDNFTFRPLFKLMIAGNHAPSLRDVGEAMRRRLIILPFVVTPLSPDPDLERKLRDEWPQILAWMIAGCRLWRANGLQRPAAIIGATDRYFADQDSMGQWLEECCDQGPDRVALPAAIFLSWSNYARAAGETAGTQKDFKAALERRGIMRAKSNGARIYRGVSLREPQ